MLPYFSKDNSLQVNILNIFLVSSEHLGIGTNSRIFHRPLSSPNIKHRDCMRLIVVKSNNDFSDINVLTRCYSFTKDPVTSFTTLITESDCSFLATEKIQSLNFIRWTDPGPVMRRGERSPEWEPECWHQGATSQLSVSTYNVMRLSLGRVLPLN